MNDDHQDNAGSDTSLWLRPLRLLFDQGTPPSDTIVLGFGPTRDGVLPFGAVTHTNNNRLIFWPVLPKKVQAVGEFGAHGVIDHVTLEFPSRKMHVTRFDDDDQRQHFSRKWRIQQFDDSGLALWFNMIVSWSVLKDQDRWLQRNIKAPTSDVERWKAEFTRYANSIKLQGIRLPPGEPEGNYVYADVYVVTDPTKSIQPTAEIFLSGGSVDDVIDDWPAGNVFGIQPMKIRVGQVDLVVVTACPPGVLKQDVVLEFPRARSGGKGDSTSSGRIDSACNSKDEELKTMDEANDIGANKHEVLKQSIKDELERTLDERANRLTQAKNMGIVPYGVFGAPSVECIDLFRDGHYYGCISLIQAVTEAIVRLVWQVKCDKKNTSEGKFKDNLDSLHKRGFIKDQLKATIDTIWEGRNSFHHLKLDLENDHRDLEQLAADKLQLLAKVEEYFFDYTIHEGRLKPKYPEYWNVNESGEVLVYMRSRICDQEIV